MKALCPRQHFHSKAAAQNALYRAVDKCRITGNVGGFGQLKVWFCGKCQRWHIHPLRVIDPYFRCQKPLQTMGVDKATSPVETSNATQTP